MKASGLFFLRIMLLLQPGYIFSQPLNDDCSEAIEVLVADSKTNALWVDGDTREATASSEPLSVCSGSWYTDDVWYKFTSPDDLPAEGITIKVHFDLSLTPTDLPAIGMAVYQSCDVGETPLQCFSSDDPANDSIYISSVCLLPANEYLIRIWSTGNTSATEGTFRITAYATAEADDILWRETFAGGIEVNGWSTSGACFNTDSNNNAGWKFLPEGLIDKGVWSFTGAAIYSPSICDGAVGVDSDFNDTGGISNNEGNGPCPTPGQHILTSPVLYSGEWFAGALFLSWHQAIRQYSSSYYISFRYKDDGPWSEWNDIEINQEFDANGTFETSNIQRHFLPGAIGHDSVQVRFIYNDNYYAWAIDDVSLVGGGPPMGKKLKTPAIAPWAYLPSDQVYPFPAMASISNLYADSLVSVELSVKTTDKHSGEDVYAATLHIDNIQADTVLENIFFPELISLPPQFGEYTMTYKVTSDVSEIDEEENTFKNDFVVGGELLALEEEFTRSVAVADGIYDEGAPLSYAYGNYYRPVNDFRFNRLIWGVNNPDDMAGQTVQLYLLEWTDNNSDHIAQSNERKYIGSADYIFQGNEGDNAILETPLDNFINPGHPIVIKGGKGYMAIVEYQASSADDPQLFLLASEARDYSAAVQASDTAVAYGLMDHHVYTSVLGFSPDGKIANIDYEVRELDVNDNRIFFGHDIVPLVRVSILVANTETQLPTDNAISVFPNPVSDIVNLKLEFTQPYSDVKLRLIDNLGRVVYYSELDNTITNHIEPISVSAFAAGNYLLQVETVDGQRSVPVIIVK